MFPNNHDKLSPFLIKVSEERYFESKGEFSHPFSSLLTSCYQQAGQKVKYILTKTLT